MWQNNPQALRDAQEQLTDASRELLTNANRLRDQGLSEEELKAVRELGEALRGGLQGNPELLDQEFQRLVNLTEQLELKLASNGSTNGERAAVRAQAPSQIAEGYEDAVAEYFRQLSRSGQPGSQPGATAADIDAAAAVTIRYIFRRERRGQYPRRSRFTVACRARAWCENPSAGAQPKCLPIRTTRRTAWGR